MPEEYFTLVMRRFMMRIADILADENSCKAIVTGENLGQVASQTMEAMAVTRAVTMKPILQPLVGMDKEEIVRHARNIGTFETSILPYEDCCTVFTPRHPAPSPPGGRGAGRVGAGYSCPRPRGRGRGRKDMDRH